MKRALAIQGSLVPDDSGEFCEPWRPTRSRLGTIIQRGNAGDDPGILHFTEISSCSMRETDPETRQSAAARQQTYAKTCIAGTSRGTFQRNHRALNEPISSAADALKARGHHPWRLPPGSLPMPPSRRRNLSPARLVPRPLPGSRYKLWSNKKAPLRIRRGASKNNYRGL